MLAPAMSRSLFYPGVQPDARMPLLAVHEAGPAALLKPRLLDRVRGEIRSRHYSRRTERAYVAWIRRYIVFHGKRHAEMGAPEIRRFLTSLAVDRKVAASTQNQALSALLFLYRDVLHHDVPWLDDLVYAKRPQRLPVILTREEVRAILDAMHGVPRLMAVLLYGAGLRLLVCAQLRVKDIDAARNQIRCARARATRTASRCCPAPSGPTCSAISRWFVPSIGATSSQAPAGSSCRGLLVRSTPTPAVSGPGSGSSLLPVSTSIG
jgi:integrase-like protein